MNRLWIRNLGRDDRAISDNGKECRYPFLDEIVVNEVSKINFKLLTKLDMPKGGGGEKYLLRQVAKRLGLKFLIKFFWIYFKMIGLLDKVARRKKERFSLERGLRNN